MCWHNFKYLRIEHPQNQFEFNVNVLFVFKYSVCRWIKSKDFRIQMTVLQTTRTYIRNILIKFSTKKKPFGHFNACACWNSTQKYPKRILKCGCGYTSKTYMIGKSYSHFHWSQRRELNSLHCYYYFHTMKIENLPIENLPIPIKRFRHKQSHLFYVYIHTLVVYIRNYK